MKSYTVFILLSLSLTFLGCYKQKSDFELRQDQLLAIEKLIERKKASASIPGIAVAVLKNGIITKTITSGLANIESGAPVQVSTVFQLASTTKSFSATAVILLIMEGKLQLTDRVGDLLEDLPKNWQGVTVRQLLSHTSGLPDVTRQEGKLDLIADSWENAFAILSESPLQFNAGEQWGYNQTNYVLLSMIIEQKSGMSFEDFMTKRLFQPLRMNSTFFTPPANSTISLAVNYEMNDENKLVIRDLSFPPYVRAAGGLWSSIDDLIRWNAALDSGKLLQAELAQKMWTSIALNDGTQYRIDGKTKGYGLGWVVDDAPDQKAVGHSGGNSTAYRRFIDEKFTIIVFHNGVYDPDALIESIARIMRSKPGEANFNPQVRLWEAAMAGDTIEIINSLKEQADIELIDTRNSKSGRRALNWAAWFNRPETVRLLVKKGANIDAQNLTGFTALHHAAEAGSLKAAKVLLELGANTNITNQTGNNAKQTALSQNHLKIVDLIDSVSQNK
jgi:CubicO group peptidase (beta-lactamase class C family)